MWAEPPTIYHRPVGCALAESFPLLEARFAPAADVAIARVLFQAQSAEWYSVKMKAEGPVFTGVLPRPKKNLKSFRYYIEVTDKALATNHTIQYVIAVVDNHGACKGTLLAGPLGSASVLLERPAGAPALPAGFASSGVVAVAGPGSATRAAGSAPASGVVSATPAAGTTGAGDAPAPPTATGKTGATGTPGTTAATGKTSASARAAGQRGGRGVGTTTLVLGGLAVAGGAVAVGAFRRGAEDSVSTPGTPATPTGPPAFWDVAFLPSPPGLDASVCAGSPAMLSSLRVAPDAAGNFNTLWPVSSPVLRAFGQALSTGFQATLACVTSDQSGSISATGSFSGYSGTFRFGAQQGQVTITRGQ